MGIKGIYNEIGAGARIAFLRLAVDSIEKRRRPLRLAIDIAIWQYQVQAARGGSNPAVRTLFYRLVRLLSMPVQPIFVFDGPNKPLFKRNKRSAGPGDSVATAMAKRMITLFGFYIHDAPGEAEAECALLQQRGVVDAVLSEDVDTLMFGCTRTLRNWSAATTTSSGKGKSSAPVTHVTMYETERHLPTPTGEAVDPAVVPEKVLRSNETGLDREGMVLVALMSGGDYIPEGVPGCGIKLACEAARAGFGRSLCRIKRSDTAAFAQWRASLQHELVTNESGFFRTCHRKLVIPEDFPNLDVLGYYTHPVVSSSDVVERVRASLAVHNTPESAYDASVGLGVRTAVNIKPLDILGLREFVADTFDWTNRGGAVKFVKVLAPALLARLLLLKWSSDYGKVEEGDEGLDSEIVTDDSELFPSLVEGVSRMRTHASTDDTPEMRVSYIPLTVVGIDLSRELDDPEASFGRSGIALNSDDEFDEPPPTAATQAITSTNMNSHTVASARAITAASPFDPAVPAVAWVSRAILSIGAPGALEEWEQKQQRVKKPTAKPKTADGAKATSTRGRKAAGQKSNMPAGALDKFVSVTKNVSTNVDKSPTKPKATAPSTSQTVSASQPVFKRVPMYFSDIDSDEDILPTTQRVPPATHQARRGGNPWSLAGSKTVPRVTKTASSGSQQTKEVHTLATTAEPERLTRKRALAETPIAAKTRPDVISLLSSDPIPAPVDVPTSPVESSLPTTSFSSLAWSPTPNRQSKQPGDFLMSSPTKQTSIRDFMPSQPPPPRRSPTLPQQKISATIRLSDDDDDDFVKDTSTTDNDDPFSSSPSIFSSRRGTAMSQALMRSCSNEPKPLEVSASASTAGVSGKRSKVSKTTTQAPKPATKAKTKAKAKATTRYVPRTSDTGYFREDSELELELEDGGNKDKGQRRGWRLSEVGVVDLTGN